MSDLRLTLVGMASTGERWTALDGLRGVAALVVVVSHVAMTNVALASTAYAEPTPGSWAWLFARTPLHLLWAGGEAVMVFFVLSGFVLALPFLRGAGSWARYYRKRLVRLYLPVWGSLAFALVLFAALGRSAPAGNTFLEASASPATDAPSLVAGAALIWVSPLNNVLWSLQWEVLFSLLLPLYVLASRWLHRFGLAGFTLPFALTTLGSAAGIAPLKYLPMFLVGCLLASHREGFGRTVAGMSRLGRASAVVVAFALLSAPVMQVDVITDAAIVAGAAMTLVGCAAWSPARRFSESRPVQWLGVRSFSLYLVHVPVILALVALFPGVSTMLLLVVAIPAALAVSAAFYKVVERPSIRAAAWCSLLGKETDHVEHHVPRAGVPDHVARRRDPDLLAG